MTPTAQNAYGMNPWVLFGLNVFGFGLAAIACMAYVTGAIYGAAVEGIPHLWKHILRPGLEREAHPMPLKYFMLAGIALMVMALVWVIVAVMMIDSHPTVAEMMNWVMAGAIALWVWKVEG